LSQERRKENCQQSMVTVSTPGVHNADNVVKFKGHRAGMASIIWKEIKERECNDELVVVAIDEHLQRWGYLHKIFAFFDPTSGIFSFRYAIAATKGHWKRSKRRSISTTMVY
jgi:hypothetical protein